MNKSSLLSIRIRRRIITAEPSVVAQSLIGLPLATVLHRGIAISIDALLILLIGIPTLYFVTYISTSITSPVITQKLSELRAEPDSLKKEAIRNDFLEGVLYLLNERMPERLPDDFRTALTDSNEAAIDSLIDLYAWDFAIAVSTNPVTEFNEKDRTASIGMNLFTGKLSVIANFGVVVLLYFTLLIWWLKGHTPGKWLMGIRVIRLDDKPVTLWNSFERAGGYSASVATFGLGFLDAIWHPNRQTVHDKIAATVVIRKQKPPKTPKAKRQPKSS